MPKKCFENLEQIELWIKENHPKYKIKEWGGGTTKNSTFIDTVRGVEFFCSFNYLKKSLKKNPDRIFSPNKEEVANIFKTSSLKKYGVENMSQSTIIKLKKEETCLKNFGVKISFKNEECLKKRENTWLKKYGETNPNKNKEVKSRAVQSFLKNNNKEDILKKKIQTNREKFGYDFAVQNPEIKEKLKEVFIKNKSIQKGLDTKFFNGQISRINGKSILDVAKEKGVSYSTVSLVYKKYGDQAVELYKKGKSSIEVFIQSFLDDLKVGYVFDAFLDKKFRPDFLIEKHNLIIECDGMYWHSDKVIENNNYHKIKKDHYAKNGYKSLFFLEDEIRDKPQIVKSIIQHHLNLDKKIGARKCQIQEIDKERSKAFFNQSHLMGNGSGTCYALICDNEIVCAIQFRCKSKKDGLFEVSRFCTKNGVSVAGGFSKLINHAIKKEKPNKIITFIDQRYGNGNYLKSIGWTFVGSHLSFKWTDYENTFHRMRFPGNSGYDVDLAKIWDCGQSKWELAIKH